jgi:hypothetical protein
VYIALSLIAQECEGVGGAPGDLGVLSIREPATLYLQSEAADWSSIAGTVVERIEDSIWGNPSPLPPPEHRPTP